MKKGSAGGKARARIQRKEALDRYYKAPNLCKFCNEIIPVASGQKVQEVRRKKFCNRSHAAKFNNSAKPKRVKKDKPRTAQKKRKETWGAFGLRKLGDVYGYSKNYTSARSMVSRHARRVWKKEGAPNVCDICGYDKHVDVCHRKPVADFDKDATVNEVNSISNLGALCPNHHWEVDHGLLVWKASS